MRRFAFTMIVMGAALTACGDNKPSSPSTAATTATTTATSPTTSTEQAAPPPKRLARLSLDESPAETTNSTLVLRGRVTRGATVSARGKKASVNRGRFRVELALRLGANRFTVVVRHPDRRTRRRQVRVDRIAPPAAPPVAAASGCPPGQ